MPTIEILLIIAGTSHLIVGTGLVWLYHTDHRLTKWKLPLGWPQYLIVFFIGPYYLLFLAIADLGYRWRSPVYKRRKSNNYD